MAGIRFINYIVDSIFYKTNPNFDIEHVKKISIDEKIFATIDILEEEESAVITLKAKVNERENVPFSFEASIVGYFEYNKEASDGIEFEKFLKTNAIAILFPYLRSLVSDITAKSNKFPNYNMPVRNISQEIEENGNIQINRI